MTQPMSELLSMIRAGSKPVIGMIQLDPLPGGSRYASRGVEAILKRALEEADTLAANGVDILMVQNLGDLPVVSDRRRAASRMDDAGRRGGAGTLRAAGRH